MNKKINDVRVSLNELSVYDLNVNSAIELYYALAKKINEIINNVKLVNGNISNELLELNTKLEYLLNNGLKEEVVKLLTTWLQDNTLKDLINNEVFKDISDKLSEFDKSFTIIKNQINKLGTPLVNAQYSLYSNIRAEIKDSDFNIGIITDTHFNNAELRPKNYNSLRELKMFNNICGSLPIHEKINLGDIVNGDYTNPTLFNDLTEYKNASGDILQIHGNHDSGGYIENLQITNPTLYGSRSNALLPPLDIYNMVYSKNSGVVIDKNTLAFYKDYEQQKIRIVHINTNDTPNIRDVKGELYYNPINWFGISPKQIKWHIDNSFNFTSKSENGKGWKIIIISHAPLEETLYSEPDFKNYYFNSGYNRSETVANASMIRTIIRKLNAGTTGTVTSYYESVPTTTTGTYKKTVEGGFIDIEYTVDRHNMNKKYYGTTFGIDGLTNTFSVNMPQGVVIPVIACLSGHLHTDNYYSLDDKTHHITLSALANSVEDVEPDNEEYAITIMSVKGNEILFFRQGRNRGEVINPTLINGKTSYGISQFNGKRFTF